MAFKRIVAVFISSVLLVRAQCPDYLNYANEPHPPFTTGKYKLPFQRPTVACRTVNNTDLENEINRLKDVISDPDLSRLFENSWPNTLGMQLFIQLYRCHHSQL
jgi:hypothetical protein